MKLSSPTPAFRSGFPSCGSLVFALGLGMLSSPAQAVTDITFFAVSDTHYGQSSATKDANRKAVVDILNTLPGKAYPTTVGGGPVGVPRAVLIPGDLIDRPSDT